MTCAELSDLLAAGPLDDLDGEERPRLDAHLASCEACRDAAAALARAHAHLAESIDERVKGMALTDDVRERTLAAVRDTLADAGKKAARPEPGPDPAAVDAVARKIGMACTYCHDRVDRQEAAFCASCLAPHHRECFATHGKCTLPGCAETRTVRPADAEEPAAARGARRRRALIIPLLVSLAGVGGGVAAITGVRLGRGRGGGTATVGSAAPAFPRKVDPVEQAAARGKITIEVTGDGPRPAFQERVDVAAEDSDLRAVMTEIGRRSGLTVLVDPTVQEDVSISLRGIPARQAIGVIARMVRCDVEELPGGVLLLTQPPRVTIQFADTDVRDVLALLAAYSRKNIVLAPDVVGSISMDFKEVHWAEALAVVADTRGFTTTHLEDAIVVSATPLDPALQRALRGPEPDATAAERDPRVTITAEHADLAALCEELGRRVERNILVDPSVREQVNASLHDVPLRHALGALARLTRCRLEERPGGVLVFTQPPKVTLLARDCPAHPWFQLLAVAGGKNVAIDQAVIGRVTANLKELEYVAAARATGAANGFLVEARGEDTLTVTATADAPVRARAVERVPGPARSADELARQVTAAIGRFEAATEAMNHDAAGAALREALEGHDDHVALAAGAPPEWRARLFGQGEAAVSVEVGTRTTLGRQTQGLVDDHLRAGRWDAARAMLARQERNAAALEALGTDEAKRQAQALRLAARQRKKQLEQLEEQERAARSALEVQAILFAQDVRYAVIDDQIHAEGDVIPGPGGKEARVRKIERGQVTFAVEDEVVQRELGE